jgi:gluconate 5-dehydrogenase
MTRALAVEYGPYGVTANLIGPGFFATELNADARMDAAWNRQVTERTPARRWGEPDDLAGAVVFLASRAAAYVNGQVLYVDGGMVGSF